MKTTSCTAKRSGRINLMNYVLDILDPLSPAEDRAYRVIRSHLPALPVVAEDGRLLGEVTVDAAAPHVAPSSWGAKSLRVFS
jgi:Mg/Co/Ni transporter MgtE